MKAKNAAIISVLLTLSIVVGFVAIGGAGYLANITGGSNAAGTTILTPNPTVANVPYAGAIAFSVSAENIGNGTALTPDTNFDVKYKIKDGSGSYTTIGLETDGTENIVVGSNDIIYAEVIPNSGQAFFLDWPATIAANPSGLVKKPAYVDVGKDGVIDYLFPLDVSKAKEQGNGNPNLVPSFAWYLKYHGDQTFSMSSPSSVLNVGTGTKVSTVTWQLTMDTQPGAEAIKAFQITVNGTAATNEVAEEQSFIDFPFGADTKRVYLSDPAFAVSQDFTSGSTKTIMRYTISSQIDGADLIIVPSQGSKVVDVDFTIATTMDASTDGVCAELRIEPINARNVADTALTDDVEFAAGATNTDECSV